MTITCYIYKITNIINNKVYIGKTRSNYGNKKWGVDKRFKKHIDNAFSNIKTENSECPRLYNSIRKYGRECFIVETLLSCNVDHIDYYEIKTISMYLSNDEKYGYNIASGGGGRSVSNVTEITRNNLSKCKNSEDFLLNIRPCYRNNELVGYVVKRIVDSKLVCKKFSSTKYTPEENLIKAKDFLENLKSGIVIGVENNKISNLPKHIFLKQRKNIPYGYEVNITINCERYNKSWNSSKQNMEYKLQQALEYRNFILNTYVKTVTTSSKEEQVNPQPSS